MEDYNTERSAPQTNNRGKVTPAYVPRPERNPDKK